MSDFSLWSPSASSIRPSDAFRCKINAIPSRVAFFGWHDKSITSHRHPLRPSLLASHGLCDPTPRLRPQVRSRSTIPLCRQRQQRSLQAFCVWFPYHSKVRCLSWMQKATPGTCRHSREVEVGDNEEEERTRDKDVVVVLLNVCKGTRPRFGY